MATTYQALSPFVVSQHNLKSTNSLASEYKQMMQIIA